MSNFPELTWSYDSSYELYTPDLFSSRLACFVGSSSGCCIYLTCKETELNTCQAATLPPKFPERMGTRNPRERDRIIQCIKLKCVFIISRSDWMHHCPQEIQFPTGTWRIHFGSPHPGPHTKSTQQSFTGNRPTTDIHEHLQGAQVPWTYHWKEGERPLVLIIHSSRMSWLKRFLCNSSTEPWQGKQKEVMRNSLL